MSYEELQIPDDIHVWKRREAERLRTWFRDEAYLQDEVLRWKSNDRPVPATCFRDAYCIAPPANAAAEQREAAAFLKRYRELDHTPTSEMLCEMRAEFGDGATVVNVITGIRTKL